MVLRSLQVIIRARIEDRRRRLVETSFMSREFANYLLLKYKLKIALNDNNTDYNEQ
jgi:hypothetical protein